MHLQKFWAVSRTQQTKKKSLQQSDLKNNIFLLSLFIQPLKAEKKHLNVLS